MKEYVAISQIIPDEISYWFCERKGHRKARNVKAVKRRFLKIYGKNMEEYFDYVCCDINAWRWREKELK